MKEIEALEKLADATVASRVGDWGMEYTKVKDFSYAQPLLDIIRKALTPPTADEVKNELDKWLKDNVDDALSSIRYDVLCSGFYYFNEDDYEVYIVQKTFDDCVAFGIHDLPPHLITLIGRFYENEVTK